MSEKAKLIENRYKKQCEICFLLDTEKADIKFHLYDDSGYQEIDKHICDPCLKDLREIRKKCHQKIDNPSLEPFKGFQMAFAKELHAARDKDKK